MRKTVDNNEGYEFLIRDLVTKLYYTGSKPRDKRWSTEEAAKVFTKSQAHNVLGGLRNGTMHPLARVRRKKEKTND